MVPVSRETAQSVAARPRPTLSRGWRAGLGFVGLAVISGLLLAPMLTYPFGRDQSVFATAADILSRGGVPYRDVWDVKPPGIFYLYLWSFDLFGRSMLAPRLLDLIWTAATAVAIWALGKRIFSAWGGAAAALFFLVRYVAGNSYWNTTQPDGFGCLALVLAAAALIGAEDRRKPWLAALCGALAAGALLLKFTLAVFLILPLVALISARGERPLARIIRGAAYLLGCTAVLALAVGLIYRSGALRDMVQVIINWNAAYSHLRPPMSMGSDPVVQTYRFLLGGRHPLLFPIGLLALIGAADLAFRSDSSRRRWLVPLWALAMVASVWVQGKFYTYHWLPVLPPLALLAGQGLRTLARSLNRALTPASARAAAVVGLAALVLLLGGAYWRSLRAPIRVLTGNMPRAALWDRWGRYGDFSLSADTRVARYLEGHTQPGQSVFIWGFEPLIYFEANRPPASRFIYTVPLVTGWSPPEWRSELIRDLEERPPACIVVAHNDPMPWMTGRADDSASQLSGFPALEALLKAGYRQAERIEDFDIWRRRG